MSYINCINKIVSTNNKIVYYEQFPPNGEDVLFYTKFDLESSLYYKDLSSSHLDASALTTTTPYDSIALNTDIRLQYISSSAGCFSQFYNGTSPDASNSAKVVLISDLSQLYLNNYIFSDVSNNLFLIYSNEQIGSNLDIILDKVESRIKKISCWGETSTGAGVILSELINNNIFAFPLDYNDGILKYNIINKTTEILSPLINLSSNSLGPYQDITIAFNNHIIGFPYNETRICDINTLTNNVQFYGSFDSSSSSLQGRFNRQTDVIAVTLSNGNILNIPRRPNVTNNVGITIYNPSTNNITTFGTNVFTYYSAGNCCGLEYINDNLIVAIPKAETKVVNINAINQTTESYGSLEVGTKYQKGVKINDDLIVCVPLSATKILHIHPISKTVETYGTFTGSNLYYTAILLNNGHVLGIPTNATGFLDIDPISKTYEIWGSLNGYYDRSYIILDDGQILLFPWSFTMPIVKVDPYNRTLIQIKILPNSANRLYGHFGYRTPFPCKIKNNQIIVTPYNYPSIIDIDPISEKLYKIGWFNAPVYAGTGSSPVNTYNMIEESINAHKFENRILICKYTSKGIIDIELR